MDSRFLDGVSYCHQHHALHGEVDRTCSDVCADLLFPVSRESKRVVSQHSQLTDKHSEVSMPTKKTDSAVDEFLRELDHPLKKEVEAVRKIILGVSPKIQEGIKWNAPSFCTSDYFATVNLRNQGGEARVWLILHTGAKKKGTVMQGKVSDSDGLLKWLGNDRCMMTFSDSKDVKKKRKTLEAIIREWIGFL